MAAFEANRLEVIKLIPTILPTIEDINIIGMIKLQHNQAPNAAKSLKSP